MSPGLSSHETVLSFFAMKPSRLETMCKVTVRALLFASLPDMPPLCFQISTHNPASDPTSPCDSQIRKMRNCAGTNPERDRARCARLLQNELIHISSLTFITPCARSRILQEPHA